MGFASDVDTTVSLGSVLHFGLIADDIKDEELFNVIGATME